MKKILLAVLFFIACLNSTRKEILIDVDDAGNNIYKKVNNDLAVLNELEQQVKDIERKFNQINSYLREGELIASINDHVQSILKNKAFDALKKMDKRRLKRYGKKLESVIRDASDLLLLFKVLLEVKVKLDLINDKFSYWNALYLNKDNLYGYLLSDFNERLGEFGAKGAYEALGLNSNNRDSYTMADLIDAQIKQSRSGESYRAREALHILQADRDLYDCFLSGQDCLKNWRMENKLHNRILQAINKIINIYPKVSFLNEKIKKLCDQIGYPGRLNKLLYLTKYGKIEMKSMSEIENDVNKISEAFDSLLVKRDEKSRHSIFILKDILIGLKLYLVDMISVRLNNDILKRIKDKVNELYNKINNYTH